MRVLMSLLLFSVLTVSQVQGKDSDLMKDLSFKTSSGVTLKYLLFIPKNYSADQKYPLVVTFHGAGSDYKYQVDNNDQAHPWIEDSIQARVPHFIMAPGCPGGSWGGMMGAGTELSQECKAVIEAIEDLKKNYSLDTNRFIIGGFSIGGAGTYHMIQFMPDYWAAACPVAAGGSAESIAVISKTPIWHHQGSNDNNGAALTRMATALETNNYPVVRVTCDMVVNSPAAWSSETQKGTKPQDILYKNANPSYDSVSKAIDAGTKYIFQLITKANHEDSRLNANHNPLLAKWAFKQSKGGTTHTTKIALAPKSVAAQTREYVTVLPFGSSSNVPFSRVFTLQGKAYRDLDARRIGAHTMQIRRLSDVDYNR